MESQGELEVFVLPGLCARYLLSSSGTSASPRALFDIESDDPDGLPIVRNEVLPPPQLVVFVILYVTFMGKSDSN